MDADVPALPSASAPLTYDNNGVAPTVQIVSANIVNSFTVNTRISLSLTFYVVDREVFLNEDVFLGLGSFITSNPDITQFRCGVFSTDPSLELHEWKTIAITSLSSIVIVPKTDIMTQNKQFTLQCHSLINPLAIASGPVANVRRLGGLTTIAMSAPFLFSPSTNLVFATLTQVNITKLYDSVGLFQEVTLNITLQQMNVT